MRTLTKFWLQNLKGSKLFRDLGVDKGSTKNERGEKITMRNLSQD